MPPKKTPNQIKSLHALHTPNHACHACQIDGLNHARPPRKCGRRSEKRVGFSLCAILLPSMRGKRENEKRQEKEGRKERREEFELRESLLLVYAN
ncbi:uncharacterized protein Bfra_006906 [Botrytis fragariae]|uniref:Uncharacterized protein n=1 Tax=Botrytis fragariae TaxID=1964551 RepID=A0A8H6B5A8_9HELO|nr:uncharacterized protein Bfra_006906 [Botrytis fragariae]KAF5879699.1 hypothetical protein Bfra_006906 [Botrytis fragariae]